MWHGKYRCRATRLPGIGATETTSRAEASSPAEAQLLNSVRYLLHEHTSFIVGAVVDKNLATYAPVKGEIPGLDPLGVVVDPSAKGSLRQMHEAGVPIVISTSRGAAEVSQHLQIPGITIIGSRYHC